MGYVYLFEGEFGICKIGKSDNIEQRFASIQFRCTAMALRIVAAIEAENAYEAEGLMHVAWNHRRLCGEWFVLSPAEIEEAVLQMKAMGRKPPPERVPFEPVITPDEVCRRYGLDLKEVIRRAKAREIPGYLITPRGWRFRISELDQVLTPISDNKRSLDDELREIIHREDPCAFGHE